MEEIVNQELCKLCYWLTANRPLTLNINKTNFVVFCSSKRKLTHQTKVIQFYNNLTGE